MDKTFSFKRLFWSYTFCIIPFALLAGLLALFGVSPIYFNEKPFYGFSGFFIAVLLIPFSGIILSAVNWVFLNFGYFLYQKALGLLKK
jgi:hypothetical protein